MSSQVRLVLIDFLARNLPIIKKNWHYLKVVFDPFHFMPIYTTEILKAHGVPQDPQL